MEKAMTYDPFTRDECEDSKPLHPAIICIAVVSAVAALAMLGFTGGRLAYFLINLH